MQTRWVTATVILAIIFYSAYCFNSCRYQAPNPPAGIDQSAHRRLLIERTGIRLSDEVTIVSETDGSPWDGMNGYYHWAVFVPGPVHLPFEMKGFKKLADERKMIDSVEDEFWPRKIQSPEGYSYHSWKNGSVDIRITAVQGRIGTYLSVETYDRRK